MPSINHRTRVSGERIKDETILGVDIGPNAVGYGELTAGLQGTVGALGSDSVGTTEIKEPGVGSANLESDSVYGAKIADDAIGSEHLEANAVGSSVQVGDNVIGNEHMRDAAIGYTELTTGLQGSLGGMPDSIGTTELKQPAVGSQNLSGDCVYGAKIADDAVGSEHIENNAISYSAQIKDDTIGSEHLANNAISYAAQIKDAIIGSEKIDTGAIHLGKLIYQPSMGSVGAVTASGKYTTYPWGQLNQGTVNYTVEPAIVLTCEGTYTAVLDHKPALGSFKMRTIAGTADYVHFIAIGYIMR